MAHTRHRRPRPLAVFCATALAIAAAHARAIALGEPDVRSALGEAVDLRIPVTIGKGESIEPGCFKLSAASASGTPRLASGRISLERSAQGTYLRIRSDAYMNEPALALGVVAACAGQAAEYTREYSLLFDPRTTPAPREAPLPTAIAAGPVAEARPASATMSPIATLIARIGDTLDSIANAIFPRNRTAKKSYIDALRETNPPLATLADNEPIPVDTPIALPDLRTFAHRRDGRDTRVATAPRTLGEGATMPAPRSAPAAPKSAAAGPAREPRAPRVAPERPAELPSSAELAAARAGAERRATAPTTRAAPTPRTQPGPGFVLKLSAAEVDVTRSRMYDERSRAQLRDRQLVLDADDQVAAVLALRNSVRQLESKVAELQLKLAGMPTSFPPPRPESAKPTPPAQAAAPKVEAPAIAPPKPEPAAPKAEPVPQAQPAAKVEEPVAKVEPPVAAAPKVESAPAAPAAATQPTAAQMAADELAKSAPKSASVEDARSAKRAVDPATDWMRYGLWALAGFLILAAITLAWRLARRRREDADDGMQDMFEPPPLAAEDDQIVVADESFAEDDAAFAQEPAIAGRRELDSDVELSTRLPDSNSDDLRRRYIEERFPEIAKGTIVLDDPDSVVKAARLFYEDGAVARAVELLRFAVERNPRELKSWLALFEIFRLERMTSEFADLAQRFREQHGKSDYWRKVQYFGREIDPANPLYQESPLSTFETIGPSQARQFAADTTFDPIAENWLGAPMDFENEVLANDLRKALMAEAGINEEDLAPNPMPALRNVEMFTVA